MNKNLISNLQAPKQQVLLSLLSGLSPQPEENTHVINTTATQVQRCSHYIFGKEKKHSQKECVFI